MNINMDISAHKTILLQKIEIYRGLSQKQLKDKLNIQSNAKSLNSLIAKKMIVPSMLPFDTHKFLVKNCITKTVVVNENGKVRESMSFPAINYHNLVNNDWINSEIYNLFINKIFCLFVFKKKSEEIYFDNLVFFSFNESDMYQLFIVWEKTKNLIVNDKLQFGGLHNKSVINFPAKKDNLVAHVRPHDTNVSEGKATLPDGTRIANYCFWLNNTFIEMKIKENL